MRYKDGARLWKVNGQSQNRRIENWLFGTIRNGKTTSKINISCAYQINDNSWEFRIWGWIPKNASFLRFNRNSFLDGLKEVLNGRKSLNVNITDLLGSQTRNHQLKVWREYNSSRDTLRPNETNIDEYLQSVLQEEAI